MSIDLIAMASGRGSNVAAIARAISTGELDARLLCVVVNDPDAPVLFHCREKGIETVLVPSKGLKKKEHEELVLEKLAGYKPDYIVLAGYMRILSGYFLSAFKGENFFRVINIHPSLLPAFPGATAYQDAFNAGVKESGITIHLVDEKIDHGPILAQAAFPRHNSDDFESFGLRGLSIEHKLYPYVLNQVAKRGIDLAAMPFDLSEFWQSYGALESGRKL